MEKLLGALECQASRVNGHPGSPWPRRPICLLGGLSFPGPPGPCSGAGPCQAPFSQTTLVPTLPLAWNSLLIHYYIFCQFFTLQLERQFLEETLLIPWKNAILLLRDPHRLTYLLSIFQIKWQTCTCLCE